MRVSNMAHWQNPYFVVREDGIGFVDLSNREIHRDGGVAKRPNRVVLLEHTPTTLS